MPLSSKRLALTAALVLASTAPLIAQQATNQQAVEKPGSLDPDQVTAGTYAVDHYHTLVRWQVDHLGITPYFGIFGDITGSLTLDPDDLEAAKVDVTIPIAKVTTASEELTAHLLRPPAEANGKPDFFGPDPANARFVSTSVVPDPNDPERASIIGELTLNGVTRPVTLDASFYGVGVMSKDMGGEEMIGFEAATTIKRSDFGVDMGIPMVSDEVKLDIVAAFVKKEAA